MRFYSLFLKEIYAVLFSFFKRDVLYMDLTEQYLEGVYETLLREQMKLLSDIKSGDSEDRATGNNKQIHLITNLMCNVLKLRDLKRKFNNTIFTK